MSRYTRFITAMGAGLALGDALTNQPVSAALWFGLAVFNLLDWADARQGHTVNVTVDAPPVDPATFAKALRVNGTRWP